MRWHRDALEFLGRLDDQVKIRGYRIEPGEVEAVLRAHPSVGEAAVVARAEPGGETVLVAYASPAEGAALSVAALREHMAAQLPAWMVPAHVVALARLPNTPSGKVDRRALPAPDLAAHPSEDAAPSEPPATPTEEAMAAIWAEVLGLERVGATDDFFDLGGHSLKATRILTRVSARLGVELPVGVIFDHPTVRGMAARVDERLAADPEDEALLDWLDTLSEEEAERLLAGDRP